MIYLDYAAATPVDEVVLAAMAPYWRDTFYNPSSPYAPALDVRRDYEAAKADIAAVLAVKPDELIMTAGATESINIACMGAGHIVTSLMEHPAVVEAARRAAHTFVTPDATGMIRPEVIAAAITDETTLVSIAYANHEVGTIQPLREIADVVHQERARRVEQGIITPIYLHTDASQAATQLDLSVSRLGVDMMTLNSGKVYGPKQVGLLWADRSVRLAPLIVGGGQERGLRSGTENVPGVIGFAAALRLASSRRSSEVKRFESLRVTLLDQLVNEFGDTMIVSGHPRKHLASHVHISFPGLDGERLLFRLETRGVMVATGSACAANKGTRSTVLTAMNIAPDVADGSLRISLGQPTTEEDVQMAARIIIEEVRAEQARVGQ